MSEVRFLYGSQSYIFTLTNKIYNMKDYDFYENGETYKEMERQFVRNVKQEIKDAMKLGKIVFAVIAIVSVALALICFL